MISQSTIHPETFSIQYSRYGKTVVRLTKNVTEETNNSDIIYLYEEKVISVKQREDIEEYITINFDTLWEGGE